MRAMETKLGDHAPGAAVVRDACALLAAWADGRTPEAPESSALELVRAAEIHAISYPLCESLQRALPAAALFCAPVMEAEREAAEASFACMAEVARALNGAGIEPVALKGGAFSAEAGAPALWRRMVDVDLLVPPARMAEALDVLVADGWTGIDEGKVYRSIGDAYAHPTLIQRGGRVLLELHARCSFERRGVLTGLPERATVGATPGLRAPTPEDRLAHLVHQVQLMDRGLPRRVVRLRDLLDWRMIRRDKDVDVEEVRARFARHDRIDAFDAFAALIWQVWGDETGRDATPASQEWAQQALAGMADPATLSPYVLADQRRAPLVLMTERGMLNEYLSRLRLRPHRRNMAARAGKLVRRWFGRPA